MQRALKPGVLQAKLTINQPGDVYEQEADRVAAQVMSTPASEGRRRVAPGVHSSGGCVQRMCKECEEEQKTPPTVQRMCSHCAEEIKHPPALQTKRDAASIAEVTPELSSRIRSLQGSGSPLPGAPREFFESRFNRDFSSVRVHTDPVSACALQARAYTVGRDIVFGAGEYAPDTSTGKTLLAHELAHVVQQTGPSHRALRNSGPAIAPKLSESIQRAGDPLAIPLGFACPTDLAPSHPTGTDILFGSDKTTITTTHTRDLTAFVATWLAGGGTDDILVHGFASSDGDQGHNWTLSCDRAQAVQSELIRLGVPSVRISIVAHGASTDFGAGAAPNRHAVVETTGRGILPVVIGTLTAHDNFSGRSVTKFGVGETIDLSFVSIPPRPAADFGGLEWALVSGGGTLTGVTNVGTGTYTAPATAGTVKLELRVAGGATAGSVISTHTISIVIPSAVRLVAVPGTAPNFGGWGNPPIAAGTWGAGFQANVFVDPKDVSFQGVVFGEGTIAPVTSGSFLSVFGTHPSNTFGPGHGGNATTGTPVSPPQDGIWNWRGPVGTVPPFGTPFCGSADFLWKIPWEFSVAGGPRTAFAAGFTANHHVTSSLFCQATIEKAGAGPFCRNIDGTTC